MWMHQPRRLGALCQMVFLRIFHNKLIINMLNRNASIKSTLEVAPDNNFFNYSLNPNLYLCPYCFL